jgi:hypothetical protein
VVRELVDPVPSGAVLLAAPRQRAQPEHHDVVPERCQGVDVWLALRNRQRSLSPIDAKWTPGRIVKMTPSRACLRLGGNSAPAFDTAVRRGLIAAASYIVPPPPPPPSAPVVHILRRVGRIGGVADNDRCDFFLGLAHRAQLRFPRPVIDYVPTPDRVKLQKMPIEPEQLHRLGALARLNERAALTATSASFSKASTISLPRGKSPLLRRKRECGAGGTLALAERLASCVRQAG